MAFKALTNTVEVYAKVVMHHTILFGQSAISLVNMGPNVY